MAIAGTAAKVLRICLFSPFRITYGDQAIRFSSSSKAIALFAYLLLNRNAPIFRDALAQQLWPDDTDEDARTNLRRYLYRVSEFLPSSEDGGSWLDISKVAVSWRAGGAWWMDAAEFEFLADASPARAVELYTGDLLPECYEDFLAAHRRRLHSIQSGCLDRLIMQSRQAQDYYTALHYANALRLHDPWREDAVRAVIELKYRLGDRSGALAEYDDFTQRLRTDLDVEPMPETTAVYRSVLQGAPLQLATPHGDSLAETRSYPLPMVGRSEELSYLRAAWERAAGARGSAVLIGGEAGIGKSRLLDHFRIAVEKLGARALLGATSPVEAQPYQAFAEALRFAIPMISPLRLDERDKQLLPLMLPELRDGDVATVSNTDRERFFDAVLHVVRGLAHERPLLFAVEDLHWAGAGTLLLFQHVAQRISDAPVLLIGTYREEQAIAGSPLRDIVRALQRTRHLTPIMLGRFSDAEVGTLVSAAFPDSPSIEAYTRRFFDLSEGNPLLLCEAIRDTLEAGWSVHDRLSHGVQQTVESRVARLRDETRTLAETAAVIGTVFDLDILRAVTGWPESDMLDCLDDLLEHQIVREVGSSSGADYAFAHHLIREAVYENVPPNIRKRRHRRTAKTLLRIRADRLDELSVEVATHFAKAGLKQDAARHYLFAARRAARLFAHHDAAVLFKQALELTIGDSQKALILDELARELGSAGEVEAACRALERCVAHDRVTRDAISEAQHCLMLGAHYWDLLDAGTSLHWRQRAVAAMQTLDDYHPLLDQARTSVARVYALCGDAGNARRSLDKVELSRDALSPKVLADYFDTAGMTYALEGRVRLAVASYERAIEASKGATDLYTGVRCRMSLGANAMCLGVVNVSRRASLSALTLARARSMPLAEAMITGNLGFLELLAGSIPAAREYLAQINAISSNVNAGYLETSSTVLAAYIACRSEGEAPIDYASAERILEEAVRSGQPQLIGDIAACLAEFYATRGDFAAAARAVDRAVPFQIAGGDVPWLLVSAAEYGNDANAAHARELLARWSEPPEHDAGHAYLWFFDALRAPNKMQVREHGGEAAALFSKTGLLHYEARSLLLMGECNRAAAIFQSMGNTRDMKRARR